MEIAIRLASLRLLLDSTVRQPYIPRHSDSPPVFFMSQGAPSVREFRALAFFRLANLDFSERPCLKV